MVSPDASRRTTRSYNDIELPLCLGTGRRGAVPEFWLIEPSPHFQRRVANHSSYIDPSRRAGGSMVVDQVVLDECERRQEDEVLALEVCRLPRSWEPH